MNGVDHALLLLNALQRVLDQMPSLARFRPMLTPDMPRQSIHAHCLPATHAVQQLPTGGSCAIDRLRDAVIAAAPSMQWQQSYRVDEVGEHYLQHYGWFELIGPNGPWHNACFRVMVGYWGAGLHYPAHRHQAEEGYLLLAGSAEFESEGRTARDCRPGDTVFHQSLQSHAIRVGDSPLLALAFWWGEGMNAPPRLNATSGATAGVHA